MIANIYGSKQRNVNPSAHQRFWNRFPRRVKTRTDRQFCLSRLCHHRKNRIGLRFIPGDVESQSALSSDDPAARKHPANPRVASLPQKQESLSLH